MGTDWDKQPDGNYLCVDCEEEVTEAEVYGDRKFGLPRCLDCYEAMRYGRES